MKTCVVFGFALSLLMPAQMWAENSVAASPGPDAVEQARPVRGHVVDETGEPLIGVTVRVLGTNGGVVTDINGDFSVNAAPGQQLQFSYAGYKTVTRQAGQGVLNLTMEP
ncbi:MAG: carboxypeptidase-like regulatory domain-containing protein, partial [Bacteroidales bacterium]|nr:carboxypeptidase-like regulatory domain-containing protein [Bacteroidales bacterium]